MRLGLALGLLILLMLSGSALAWTFGPMTGIFAQTVNGAAGYQVKWQANVTIETNSLVAKTDEIVIADQRLNFQPDGLQKIHVYIVRYSNDWRQFRVVMQPDGGTRTALTVQYSNPGNDLKVYEAGVNTKTCAVSVSLCSWTFANATSFNFSVLTPLGIQQLTGEQPTPPPAEAGGGGGSSTPTEAPRSPLDLPSPLALFPRFSAWRWLAVIAGLLLVLNGTGATRRFTPLRIPIRADVSLFLGSVILVLAYLWPT